MKINGIKIPTPSKLNLIISDIDGESYRNAKGRIVRDRIATKRKLDCEWNCLTEEQASSLLKAVKDTFFSVEYFDAYENENVTKSFYVGDRTMSFYSLNPNLPRFSSIKMNFVER